MDEHRQTDVPAEPIVETTSTEYLGRWNRLISTTNWEKGRIICQWREALRAAGAEPADYTDEAWSRRACCVSAGHVGRLRRVFERFGETHQQYPGLYWSHFQAALDWDDAEMWLEGAVHEGWTVAKMRAQRWEMTGAAADKKPRAEDIKPSDFDEDVAAADDEPMPAEISESMGEVRRAAGAPSDRSRSESPASDDALLYERPKSPSAQPAVEPFQPFEHVPPLPPDLDDAYRAMRQAILRHKVAGWREITCNEVVEALDALKQLAWAPMED